MCSCVMCPILTKTSRKVCSGLIIQMASSNLKAGFMKGKGRAYFNIITKMENSNFMKRTNRIEGLAIGIAMIHWVSAIK